ncbi:MAG: hypothetical protein K9L78_03105 [Victivallales bacterium]|nr:hypothetical protein [Victivallales bacterium]MCF7889086.1 hypothetical protein [Victivallales bacterium]
MLFPEDLLYTKYHLWLKIEEDTAVVGVTEELLNILGAIDEVEFPRRNDELEMEIECGILHYPGGVQEIYAPLTGRVTKINNILRHDTKPLHLSCYEDGWLFEMEYDDVDELELLLTPKEYSLLDDFE